MEKLILDLINDDYYALWEIKSVVEQNQIDHNFEDLKKTMARLIHVGRVSLFVSEDLSFQSLVSVEDSAVDDLISDERNWEVINEDSSCLVAATLSA